MKKLTLIALSVALFNPATSFAQNNVGTSGSALYLTHDEIFGIYKSAEIVRDELELPKQFQGVVSATYLTLRGIERRLRTMQDELVIDLFQDYRHSEIEMNRAEKKLNKMIINLTNVVKKLNKIEDGYIKNPKLIDTYYSFTVMNQIKIKKVIRNSKKMVDKNEIGDSWAHEINLLGSILLDISNGYKEKSLRLILERGDITGQTERPHAEALSFKF